MRLELFTVIFLLGCRGVINGPTPQAPLEPNAPSVVLETPTENVPSPQYSSARCEGVGAVRSFVSLSGQPLEADRVDAPLELDTRRTRSWETVTAYGQDLNQQLGYYRASEGALELASIPLRATFWHSDAQMGALELYSQFRIGFILCNRMLAEPNGSAAFEKADLKAAPTAATAPARCRSLMLQLWKEGPSAEQVASCAAFAVDETADLPTVADRWALVCAAMLSSTGSTTQ